LDKLRRERASFARWHFLSFLAHLVVEPGGEITLRYSGLLRHAIVDEDRRRYAHREVERIAGSGIQLLDAKRLRSRD
jgi:hypothetical protein